MREYGQVQSAFWYSSDFKSWSGHGRILALYLLTGPHANGIGCYPLPDGYVMADLGWRLETVSKGFAELSASGFANRFEEVVFIPNFLRWNVIANPNVAKARIAEFDTLPSGQAKNGAARALLEFCGHLTDQDRNRLETVSKGFTEHVRNRTLPNPTQKTPNPKSGAHAASAARGCRLPPEWQLTSDLREMALAINPRVNPENEAEKFRDFWLAKSGRDATKLDWAATWRNWIRRSTPTASVATARGSSESASDRVARINREAEARERISSGRIIEGGLGHAA